MEHYIEAVVTFLSANEVYLYTAAFIVGLAESLPVIGVFSPATPLLVAFGIVAGLDNGNIYLIAFLVTIGCILSDWIAFWLGQKSKIFFKPDGRFLRSAHIEKGEAFFERFGSWSIFFGRFVGPLRPIMPFVAGICHMNKKKFWLFNVASAVVWSIAYTVPGYVAGHALSDVGSLEHVILYATLALIAFYVVAFSSYRFVLKYFKPKQHTRLDDVLGPDIETDAANKGSLKDRLPATGKDGTAI
jgi:undecaprenyl-diphosphatase